MFGRYEEIRFIITERTAESGSARLGQVARQTRTEQRRRLAEMRSRIGGAISGAGTALVDPRTGEETRTRARRPA